MSKNEIKTLDEIRSDTVTVMTWPMLVLFAHSGCMPTICHACEKKIKAGDKFKLVPHQRKEPKDDEVARRIPSSELYAYYNVIDEMCCLDCGTRELNKRDRALERDWRKTRSGGFSRRSIP